MNTKTDVKSNNLMTEGSIARRIFFFSVPLILGNLLQQLYNTADSIIVGNFIGSGALAAVGSGAAVISMLIAFSQGASVGAGVVVSQYLGAKQKIKVHFAVHTSLAIALISGLILTISGVLITDPLLIWMNTPQEVFADSSVYLRIYFGGIIFNVIYNMASGILNAAGNSKRSLLYLGYASLVNIALDVLFIKVFGMGVEGAALATDISQFISSAAAIVYLMQTPEVYRLNLKKLWLSKKTAAKIIKTGLPTGIQNMVISFSNILVQSGVNTFGAFAMAGFGAYMKIDGFNVLPVLSLSMAATTFTGQNYGAKNIERIKKGLHTTLILTFFYTAVTGALLLSFSNPLMRLFTDNTQAIAYGELAMRYFCPFYFLLGVLHAIAGTVRGTGSTVPPMLILLFSLCLFRIVWMQFVMPILGSIESIYILYPVSWLIGTALMILYACKGQWLRVQNIL